MDPQKFQWKNEGVLGPTYMGELTPKNWRIHVGSHGFSRVFFGTGVGSFVGTLHGAGATSTGFWGHGRSGWVGLLGAEHEKNRGVVTSRSEDNTQTRRFWKEIMEITEFMIHLAFLMPFFWHSKSFQHLKSPSRQCLVRPSSPPLRSCNLPQSKEWRVLLKQWPRPCTEMDIHISGFVIDLIYRNLPPTWGNNSTWLLSFEWVANTQYLIVSYCCYSYLTHRYSSYHQYCRIVYSNYDTCSGISCCILLPISAIILMLY